MIIKDLELQLLRFDTRKSIERLNELLDDDFVEFAQDGKIYSKKDIINILPKLNEERITIYDYLETLLSDNTIHVKYSINREVLISGEKYSTLCSSIWQNKNGNWKMTFFQGTKKNNK